MLDVREVFFLQVWFSNRNDWVDIQSFDTSDLAHDWCDRFKASDPESKFRVVRRWH